MEFLGHDIAPLGMGCWPIGGAMYHGTQSLGYTGADDDTSVRTIHAALDGGITLFDTAVAYGAGHSERLLGTALLKRSDALVVTKIGIGIDEAAKQVAFDGFTQKDVGEAIEGSLERLNRDCIDMVLLHLNEMPVTEADPIFDAMERVKEVGKIRSYGWSTDYSTSAAHMADRPGFQAVEFAMNVFFDAPRMQQTAAKHGLYSLIRSPLAMGLLTGKYDGDTSLPANDIRASGQDWMEYYKEGRANPSFLATLDAVRDLLTSDGRTLIQGALGWIWGQSETHIPIPGARTPEQITGLAAALETGPLSADVMAEIEGLIARDPSEPDRPR